MRSRPPAALLWLLLLSASGCPAGEPGGASDLVDAAAAASGDALASVDSVAPADALMPADTVAPADTLAPADVVRVVSLNLRCLIDDWDARRPLIVDALAEADPHLIGFQEVCAEPGGRDALAELLAALEARTGRSYTTLRAVTHRAWDTYDEGLAVVSAWPLEETAVEALPQGVFPRKLLLARVTPPSSGEPLVFSTTHLDHQSDLTRKRQAEAVVAALGAFAGETAPRVLTGDLNEGPSAGAVYATLAGAGLTDLWGALHPDASGDTYPASNPRERIDYVWLDAAATETSGVAIDRILGEAVAGVTGSDHLGLLAVLAR